MAIVTLFITSGTSYTLPNDFNPGSNTVECYGSGSYGNQNGYDGGGGGSYAKSTNVNVGAGATVSIGIGVWGAVDTYFNATSLANAVSKGVTLSCGAQGSSGTTGGQASASCGVTKYNGGNGGSYLGYGGGGGGGGAGPNGAGASGGASAYVFAQSGINGWQGGGGGGCNGGSPGNAAGQGGYGTAGSGGNNRFGGGGGAYGSYPYGTVDGAAGTAGGGGGGGGGNGGNGSRDEVYGAGAPGPGSGGGGGAGYSNGAFGNAGWGYGYGGGGGGSANGPAGPGQGLIVLTYTPVTPGSRGIAAGPILTLRAPTIVSARGLRQQDAPPTRMDWLRQPADLLQPPPGKIIYKYSGSIPQPFPNPTPLFKPPWLQWPELLRHPVAGLDYRQQFPGKAPMDFYARILEGPDTLSAGMVAVNSPINANLLEYDEVTAIINPAPELGGSDDVIRRVKLLLPKGWWNDIAPIRDAIIGGIADAAAWSYSLVAYAKKQTRVTWATDLWLDIISKDYFKFKFPRRVNEQDEAFRARIQKELIRERVTRKGMHDVLLDLTGKEPWIFEPWNTGDAGAWDVGIPAFDIAGGWGDTILPAQSFVNVIPPGAGIPGAPGWDVAGLGWDIGGMWGDMNLIAGTVTDQDIYDTINITRPVGAIVWTQLSAPQGPFPLPVAPTLTPTFAPPGMIPLVVQPGPQRYSIPVMPDCV